MSLPIRLLYLRLLAVMVAVGVVSLVASCDSSPPQTLFGEEAFVEGTVSVAQGHTSDWASPAVTIADARVTASVVGAGGELQALPGQAMTDGSGRYRLNTTPSPHPMVLSGVRGSVQVAALLEEGIAAEPEWLIIAPPMTVESTAEAAVFQHARRHSTAVTVADASALVGRRTVTLMGAGSLTTAQVASAFISGLTAQTAFAARPGGGNAPDVAPELVEHARRQAYALFRVSIIAAHNAQARRLALDAFIETYADSWARAGLGLWPQAETSIVGYGALRHGPSVTDESVAFGLAHRALLVAMTNVSVAIVHGVATGGGGAGSVGALTIARMELFEALREAATPHDAQAALAAYREVVFEELAELTGTSISQIEGAYSALTPVVEDLRLALGQSAEGSVVANVHIAYFAAARAVVSEALGADAVMAVQILPALAAL